MKRFLSNHWPVVAVILFAGTLAFTSSLGDSPIVDEIPHIGAGYSYVARGDMRLNPEHPPLVKDLAGLALLPLHFNDTAFRSAAWQRDANGQWNFGRSLIFQSGVSADTVKNVARLPMLGIFALGCWLVWAWTRQRSGRTAGLIALILFAFSPTILAHGHLVTTDVAAAVGVVGATWCFIRYLRSPNRNTFIIAALTLGLALLTKFNVVLLGPYFLILAALYGTYENHRNTGRSLMHALGRTSLLGLTAFVFVVWPVYSLHTIGYPIEKQAADTKAIMSWHPSNPLKSAVIWASDKPILRAAGHWGLGLAMVIQRAEGGNTIYWLGQVVDHGGPWYFPVVYLLKEPLAWWPLIALAVAGLVLHHRKRTLQKKHSAFLEYLDEWAWVIWLGIYWLASVTSTLNIGVRHLIPIYPFTIMLVAGRLSALTDWLRVHDQKRMRAIAGVIGLLLGWYVFSSIRAWPHYLSYFNEIAGGSAGGYRFVTDSNLDWGQDLKRLSEYVKENKIPVICLDYFGWADPAYYLPERTGATHVGEFKDLADFRTRNICGGWIAISATFLQNANGQHIDDAKRAATYRWLIDQKPATVIGNSIFVWHIK